MTNRLLRWGERALGQVRSVSPRVSSRFEPEAPAGTLEEQTGFQEIDVETPAPRRTVRVGPPEPPEPIVSPTAEPEILETKTEPARATRNAVPPLKAIEPRPSPPQPQKPETPRQIEVEPAFVSNDDRQPDRQDAGKDKRDLPADNETQLIRVIPETSVARLKHLQEWIASPPREPTATPEPASPPPSRVVPVPVAERSERDAPTPPPLPPPVRAEPVSAPLPTVVVSIGTIIVRANPAAAPRPAAPPPAAGLANFLARRTAGRP